LVKCAAVPTENKRIFQNIVEFLYLFHFNYVIDVTGYIFLMLKYFILKIQ